MKRESVLEAQRINAGTRIFQVEHACHRPRREGTIFDPTIIDRCQSPGFYLAIDRMMTAGIDWGLTECAMVLVGEWLAYDWEKLFVKKDDESPLIAGIGMIDVRFLRGEGVDEVVEQLIQWQEQWGDNIRIRADGSHPYNNRELAYTYKYWVRPVHGDKGNYGKANVARWMASGFFQMLGGFELLIQQMKNLRRNMATGKQIKKNKQGEEGDHGPDALRIALMQYDYLKWYRTHEQAAVENDDEDEEPEQKPKESPGLWLPRREKPAKRNSQDKVLHRTGDWRGKGLDEILLGGGLFG